MAERELELNAPAGRHCRRFPTPGCPPSRGGARREESRANNAPVARYTRVRSLLLASSLVLGTVAAGSAFAQSSYTPAASTNVAAMARAATPPAQAGDVRLSPAANDAVQLVDAFAAALVAGQLEAARQFMAPSAVVVANGQIIGDRDAYIDGPARGDAAALRTVQRDVLRRKVDAGPDFGCVVSEKRVRAPGDTKGPGEVVIETMLIARTAAGWKITHIHWSGRRG